MNPPSRASSAFSWIAGLCVVVALVAANTHFFLSRAKVAPWERFRCQLMIVYLALVTLRARIVHILSFGYRFFQEDFPETSHYPMVSILVPCFNEEVVIGHAVDSLLQIGY